MSDIDQGTAYFPDKDRNFNLKEAGVKYLQDLEVEGLNLTAASARMSGSSLILPQGVNSTAMLPPLMGSGVVLPPIAGAGSSARKKESAFLLIITKAEFGQATPGRYHRSINQVFLNN